MTNQPEPSRVVIGGIILVAIACGYYVAESTVGFYPPINHCPNQQIACPSGNIRNVIPSLVASAVAIPILLFLTICYNLCRRYRYESQDNTT